MSDKDWSSVDEDELDDAVADGDYDAMSEAGLRQARELSECRARISTLEADLAREKAVLADVAVRYGEDHQALKYVRAELDEAVGLLRDAGFMCVYQRGRQQNHEPIGEPCGRCHACRVTAFLARHPRKPGTDKEPT